MVLMARTVPGMRAGHVDVGSTSGRSTVDRSDAVASVRGERARVPCRLPAHGLHGTDGHLFRMDDRSARHRGIPRSVVLGRRPRRGHRGPPVSWANARVAVPAIWLFTALTLVATLLHFDQFHFSSPIA